MKQVLQNLQNPMVERISKLVFEHKKLLAIASILFQRKTKYSRGDLRSFYKHAVKLATLPGVHDKQFTEVTSTSLFIFWKLVNFENLSCF